MQLYDTGAAVISSTSYLYAVWTQVSYQALSPTNGLGMRLVMHLPGLRLVYYANLNRAHIRVS